MRLQELKVKRGGKSESLPIHFGFNTQADFCEYRNISLQDWDERVGGEKMRLADISALAYFALKRGHERSALKDIPFDLSIDDSVGRNCYSSASNGFRLCLLARVKPG